MNTISKIRNRQRHGLSLLEVILSMAILGISMTAIGALVSNGYRAALETRLRSDGNLLCETKMSEVVAGIIELESTNGVPIEENQEWEYSIQVEPSDQLGLLFVRVSVMQTDDASINPIEISFVRFLPDPDYEPDPLEDLGG